MFGYFPFLDCDDLETYSDACFHLCADGIPFISYKSSPDKDSYWILCDRQGNFDDTLSFIESYPCDHRYPWMSKLKKEFCIRAIPRSTGCPLYIETNLKEELSLDFAYFMDRFTDYWNNGLIVKYMGLLKAAEEV